MRKIKSIACIAVIALLQNCSSNFEIVRNSGALSLDREEHSITSRPFEIQTEVSDKTTTVTVRRSNMALFYATGDGVNNNFLRRVLAGAAELGFGGFFIADFFLSPYRQTKNGIVDIVIAGDENLVDAAQDKAVKENQADGFFITNVRKTSNWYLLFREQEVTLSGKIVKFVPIGPVSNARLGKVAAAIADQNLEKTNTRNKR